MYLEVSFIFLCQFDVCKQVCVGDIGFFYYSFFQSIERNADVLLNASKGVGLAVNTG